MALTLGLRRPVPATMSPRPTKKNGRAWNARLKWPSAIKIPPTRTLLYCPSSQSAMSPPAIDAAQTLLV